MRGEPMPPQERGEGRDAGRAIRPRSPSMSSTSASRFWRSTSSLICSKRCRWARRRAAAVGTNRPERRAGRGGPSMSSPPRSLAARYPRPACRLDAAHWRAWPIPGTPAAGRRFLRGTRARPDARGSCEPVRGSGPRSTTTGGATCRPGKSGWRPNSYVLLGPVDHAAASVRTLRPACGASKSSQSCRVPLVRGAARRRRRVVTSPALGSRTSLNLRVGWPPPGAESDR